MKILLITSLLFVSSFGFALSPQPAESQKDAVVYHNATLHIGNGKVLKNATIAFENGKITQVGYFKMAWKKSDIDLKGQHVYPGFILPITNLGLNEVGAIKATKDDVETGSMNANVRAIVAYNTDSEVTPTLKFNGVLLAQITPKGGLVSGLSSVVQLDAWNWEDALISSDDAVHVNWPSSQKYAFDFSTFTVKLKENKEYAKQIEEIKTLFKDAKASLHKQNGQVNIKLDAVTPVFTGSRAVYIHASSPKSIVESINFFKSMGVKNLVLVSEQAMEPVIGFIKQSGVPVIVESAHTLPDQSDRSVDSGYTIAVKLHQAGILTGLAYNSGMMMKARNLGFAVGTLVAYGLEKNEALKLITSNTAEILGIDAAYGTLEVGKSATLFVSKGDALDMRGNTLTAAYIDGRKLELKGRQQELNQRFLKKYNLK